MWYHVLQGEKVFLLIEPTAANLEVYARWATSDNQEQVFLPDLLPPEA